MCLGRLYVIGLLEGAMMGLGKNLLISTRVPNLQFLTFWPVFLSRTKSSISCFCEKWAAHFAKRNTKFGGGESEGGQKFLPSNPLPFCPPERSVLVLPREARQLGILFKKGSSFVQ